MANIKKFESFKINEYGLDDSMYRNDKKGQLYRYNNENPAIELEEETDENYMVEQNLETIMDNAYEIKRKLKMGFKLEEWAKDHIATSADDIQEVYNYFK